MINALLRSFGLFALLFVVACSTADDPVSPTTLDTESTFDKESSEITAVGITIVTDAGKYLTSVSATSGGTITSTKNIKERGVCYGTSTKPTINNSTVVSGAGTGSFESVMTGLASDTKYFVRAYVKYGANASKVAYGPQMSFTTLESAGTVTDADGNVYNTVTIGNQVWLAENLRTTKYRDGTDIDNVTDAVEWFGLTAGAYCSYDNSAANGNTYGLLYNWYAVDDARNIAPEGWHVPTPGEYGTLDAYFGTSNTAGGYMKEAGLDHWNTPNTGATNGAGFNARGNGSRMLGMTNCFFTGLTNYSPWWTSVAIGDNARFKSCQYADTRSYQSSFVLGFDYYNKGTGYAVRLVKD